MKKIKIKDGIETIATIKVVINFKDITWWDKEYCHHKPCFEKFWDKWNSINKDELAIWHVAYYSKSSEQQAIEGKLDTNYVRFLVNDNTQTAVTISDRMVIYLQHEPSIYPTTHACGLSKLVEACEACAKYCKTTVDITFSGIQHRFEWKDKVTRTITCGYNMKEREVKDIKRFKRHIECIIVQSNAPSRKA